MEVSDSDLADVLNERFQEIVAVMHQLPRITSSEPINMKDLLREMDEAVGEVQRRLSSAARG